MRARAERSKFKLEWPTDEGANELPTSSREVRIAELAAAAATAQLRPKPSTRWRNGYMLYGGWPAQEGGPESGQNGERSSYSLIAPAMSLEDAQKEAQRQASKPAVVVDNARAASWAARYPAWWTEASIDVPPSTSAQGDAAASPSASTSAAAADAPLSPPCPPRTSNDEAEPPPQEPQSQAAPQPPPSSSAPDAASSRRMSQGKKKPPPVRSALMPCMRPSKQPQQPPVAAPAVSKVKETLRKEAALRKQMAAARRRRLEAIVGRGAAPEDVPIEINPRAAVHRRDEGDAQRRMQEASLAPEETGWGLGACAWGAPPSSPGGGGGSGGGRYGREPVSSGLLPPLSSGLEEADAAIEIAQRFLGSSLGGHFVDAASGEAHPRPLTLSAEEAMPTANAQLRIARASASVAATMLDGSATGWDVPIDVASRGAEGGADDGVALAGEDVVDAVVIGSPPPAAAAIDAPEEAMGEEMPPEPRYARFDPDENGEDDDAFGGGGSGGGSGGSRNHAAEHELLDAVVARFGLHTTPDEDRRRAWGLGMADRLTGELPASSAEWPSEPPVLDSSLDMSEEAPPAQLPAPTAWSVDVADLRGAKGERTREPPRPPMPRRTELLKQERRRSPWSATLDIS